jgi:hypothetical protein
MWLGGASSLGMVGNNLTRRPNLPDVTIRREILIDAEPTAPFLSEIANEFEVAGEK